MKLSGDCHEQKTKFLSLPPRVSLKYPLKVKNEWIYFENNHFKIQKSVTGIKEIITVAGKFECYEIKLKYLKSPVDSTAIKITEYYAVEGLIKRSIISSNIRMTNTYGEDSGNGELNSEYELIEYSLTK